MRILQLSSDWKWTGPAAPMLGLSLALRARGHWLSLICAEAPAGMQPSLHGELRAAGLEPAMLLERSRGVHWQRDRSDARRLRELVDAEKFDVVHCWHTRDHVLALRATGLQRRSARTRLVRSYKSAERIRALPWNRWLFGRASDGLVCVSPETARRNRRLRGGRPVVGAFGAVDLERFQPGEPGTGVREALGLDPRHRVVGIVARAQRHRRFDLLLEAAAWLSARDPHFRLLVVGRGTHLEETALRPVRRLGIEDRVIFAGYRSADYVEVLRCMQVFTFLVPGSDGGCRALLEAAACGLPAVTSRRGALPEIVVSGRTGITVPEDPEALGAAWQRLLRNDEERAALGQGARERAVSEFGNDRFASVIEALYREAGAGS